MSGLEEYLATPGVYWAFFFIFGSYILAYKANNLQQLSSLVSVPMLLAFAISAFLILKEPIPAVVNTSVRDGLSNDDVLTLSLIALMYFLMFATALIINFRHTPPEPKEPHDEGKSPEEGKLLGKEESPEDKK